MKIDWRMTNDGDLELGSESVDEEGNTLYVTTEGVVSTDSTTGFPIRDIPLQVSYMSDRQVVLNRLKTTNPDWALHPTIGADLSELIGLPNSRATGDKGRELIEKALCYDNFVRKDQLIIKAIPIDLTSILFRIQIMRTETEIIIPVVYHLEHGILTEYEVKTA